MAHQEDEEAPPPPIYEPVPGTPGIREVPGGGIRKVGLRAEIDTSPPFGSVKEAVTRFGGSGPWLPHYKLGDGFNGEEEFDIKKVEEQAAELEKDLIVKELQTLDVLEELGTTKKIVEDLKLQIQKEALTLKSTSTPPQLPNPNQISPTSLNIPQITKQQQSPAFCPISSPDSILMELKQAKLNLGRTITDLSSIQSSVESINRKMKKEQTLLEKSKARATRNEVDNTLKSPLFGILENAEMRWIAAKKMEEAAKAAEALAFAEIKALSGSEMIQGKIKKVMEVEENGNFWNLQKMLDEASADVTYSKSALEEALSRVEMANKKQLAVGEALRNWISRDNNYRNYNYTNYNPPISPRMDLFHSPLNRVLNRPNLNMVDDSSKPVLRPTVSMRDILSRKQVLSENCAQPEVRIERRKVALSQMLQELRDDLNFSRKDESECDDSDRPKPVFPQTQRRKFGFIHISLPLSKQSKKRT